MAANGWYCCNVQDRVLCLYCNTICHQWTSTDDPAEVHARLAPECVFVRSMASNKKSRIHGTNPLTNKSSQPRHSSMRESTRREATFDTKNWTQTSPTVADLVQAGFYYTGVGNTVTCFFCDGSLQKWGPNDSPRIEHARWFPHCQYAKDLCEERLHAQIQLRHAQNRRAKQPNIEGIERLITARLDLPIVDQLRSKYRIDVIKKCIETRLKLGADDFVFTSDLEMACYILQKQIDIIKGHPGRLIIPSWSQPSHTATEESPKRNFGECAICLTEERQVACVPCGHLCTCVVCGYAVRSCPVCREEIQSLVRIY